jgi:hypothetical protein
MSLHKNYSFFFFSYFIALVHTRLVLLDVCNTNIHLFSFPVPRMCVLYHNLYCILPCNLPLNYLGLKCLKSVNWTVDVQGLG